jgi:energy-coupling factor transporter ATP-binding protein EcfA2
MKVVELCGPTGAGKSTIYEAIQQMIVSEGLTDKFCDGYTNEELDGTKIDVTPQLEPFIKLLDKTFKEAYGPRLEKRAQGTAKAMTKIIRAHRENDSRTMVIDDTPGAGDSQIDTNPACTGLSGAYANT